MTHGQVCLTFDFDGPSAWVARGVTTATPLSRGEYAAVAAPRVLSVLRRRGLTSTWFVPAHTVRTYPDVCRRVLDEGHEIALHGYAHENVAALPHDEERDRLARSIEVLEASLGVRPSGFRAPSWDLSAHSVDLMAAAGLTYDSSLMGHDHAPYPCRSGDHVDEDGLRWGEPTRVVEIPVSWTLDDFPFLEFLRGGSSVLPGVGDPRQMFGRWEDDLHWMLRELDNGVLTVTCHPEVIGRGHRLLALEEWLDRLVGRVEEQEISVVRCDDVARRFAAGEKMGAPRPDQA
jgi:peptidoglycan/xylan/chitin deacetylase (PgdA/CDA1 family)